MCVCAETDRLSVAVEALRLWSEFDTGNKPHGGEQREDGRAAVAEKRQRQADDGGEAHAHADVDESLEQDGGGNTEAYEHAHGVFRVQPNLHAAENDQQQQYDDRAAADHAELLADHGEDKVRLLFGNGAALRLGAVIKPGSGELTGSQRQLALARLPDDGFVVGNVCGGEDFSNNYKNSTDLSADYLTIT